MIPWGKMSLAYFAARGDVPIDPAHADSAWACTGCHACRESCDHRNEVGKVLGEARAEYFARGVAPEAAVAVAARFDERQAESARALDALAAEVGADAPDGVAVLVGCGYVRSAPDVARDALVATGRLLGKPIRAVRACCGLPLLHAGDRPGFMAAARRFADDVASAPDFVAVDPGCARTLLYDYPRLGVEVRAPRLFVDLAHEALTRLASVSVGELRWHDPCQLGRGLSRYEEPRRVLERIAGAPPAEFDRAREHAECSGAGGLLPVTRPNTSRAIADGRIAEHQRLGGGTIVTACAQSLRRFRSRGEQAEDLVSLVARALEATDSGA